MRNDFHRLLTVSTWNMSELDESHVCLMSSQHSVASRTSAAFRQGSMRLNLPVHLRAKQLESGESVAVEYD